MVPRLWLSPMSIEILEAIMQVHSELREKSPLAMMCSVNHVNEVGIYTGITYEKFKQVRDAYYPIQVERDHLGKKPNADIDMWIRNDIANDFDGCMLHTTDTDLFQRLAMKYGPTWGWNVGPGEDTSKPLGPDFFKAIQKCGATWTSVPLGTLICGLTNVNEFDKKVVEHIRNECDVLIRAHNCDYMPAAQLKEVLSYVDGINIAPQLGVIQSCCYLSCSVAHGLDIEDWKECCLCDTKKLWHWDCGNATWFGIGHYYFNKIPWRRDVFTQCVESLKIWIRDLIKELDL